MKSWMWMLGLMMATGASAGEDPVPVAGTAIVTQTSSADFICESPLLAQEQKLTGRTKKCLICSNGVKISTNLKGLVTFKSFDFRVAGNFTALVNEAEEGRYSTSSNFIANDIEAEAFGRNGNVTLIRTRGGSRTENTSAAAGVLMEILNANCN